MDRRNRKQLVYGNKENNKVFVESHCNEVIGSEDLPPCSGQGCQSRSCTPCKDNEQWAAKTKQAARLVL